jgi:A/G-specific adenine glycosylase
VNAQLWHLAERETPLRDVARYTQAIMDLGATVCTRARVSCAVCPLRDQCGAFGDGRVAELPRRRSRAARRVRTVFMLVAQRNDGCVLLERRAHQGIWGGLWSLPEFVDRDTLKSYCAQKLLKARATAKAGPPIEHAFTHFDLIIMPLRVPCAGAAGVMDTTHQLWYNPARPEPVGLPAPVQRLLAALVDRLAD